MYTLQMNYEDDITPLQPAWNITIIVSLQQTSSALQKLLSQRTKHKEKALSLSVTDRELLTSCSSAAV